LEDNALLIWTIRTLPNTCIKKPVSCKWRDRKCNTLTGLLLVLRVRSSTIGGIYRERTLVQKFRYKNVNNRCFMSSLHPCVACLMRVSTTSYQNCNVIAVNPEALNYRNNPFRLKLDKQRVSLILIVMNYLEIKIRSLSVQ